MARTAPPPFSPAEQARRVVAFTAQAWGVAPASAAALARRAPRGYVRSRVLRHVQAQALPAQLTCTSLAARTVPLLAHSW